MQTFGAGEANALAACSNAFGCDCFPSCVPTTCQAANVACGVLNDGCGGVLSCGSCSAGQTCTPQGQCVSCRPATCASLGRQCGAVPDGCGGLLQCGSCPAGTACGGGGLMGQCGSGSPTLQLLQAQDKPGDTPDVQCSTCTFSNGCVDPLQQGTTCENVAGVAPAACQAVLGASSAVSEAQVCLQTLSAIFASRCGESLQLLPCICGPVPQAACLTGEQPAQGALMPEYTCDFGTSDAATIVSEVNVPTFGAGAATALAVCSAGAGCDCF